MTICLVVWNIWIIFPFSWECHHFSEGLVETTNQLCSFHKIAVHWEANTPTFRHAKLSKWWKYISPIPIKETVPHIPQSWLMITLWWTNILLLKITIFYGKIHYFYGHFQLQTVSSPEGNHIPWYPSFSSYNLVLGQIAFTIKWLLNYTPKYDIVAETYLITSLILPWNGCWCGTWMEWYPCHISSYCMYICPITLIIHHIISL